MGKRSAPTLAKELGQMVFDTSVERIPGPTVDAATNLLIDTVGCTLAGSQRPVAQSVLKAMSALVGESEKGVEVIGTTARLPPAHAAFAMATAAHALELDDTDAQSFCHVGAVVIPAALAVAQERSSSGAELLGAIVGGYEVAVRLARMANPSHRLRGFHTTANVPAFGAAAASARLLGGGPEDIANAIAVSASFLGGTFEFLSHGSNIKRVHAGKASFAGITGAVLALNGVDGPPTALEGEAGFFATMTDRPRGGQSQLEHGDDWLIDEIGIKPYPCCRFCHSSIDSALHLYRPGVSTDEIESITISVSELCARQTGDATPHNELRRQFSTPYSVGVALLRGRVGLDDYQQPDLAALDLATLCAVEVNGEIGPTDRQSDVTVRWRDGTVETARTLLPRGEPQTPLTGADIEEKFFDLAGTTLEREFAGAALRRLRGVRDAANLRGLMQVLTRLK